MTRGLSAAPTGRAKAPQPLSFAGVDRLRATAILALVLATVAVGLGTALDPAVAALVVGVTIAVIGVIVVGDRIGDAFLGALAVMLVGYAFLGRSFAYLGVAPLYLGELALPIALVALVRCRERDRFQPIHGLLLVFMAWGALQTVPYLPRYGIDALRDAVTWGYGLYAIAVSFILTSRHLRAGISVYGRLIPVFLLWVPVAALLTLFVSLPNVPGSAVPIVVFKGGDFGVHLAGIAAFIFLGLYAAGRGIRLPEPLIWIPWLFAVAVAGILNRGGLVAASMAAATLLYVRAATRWLAVIFIAVILMVPVILIDPRIELGTGREISVGQMVDNVTSLFGEADNPGLEGTKEFRLRWWSTIVGYTIGGPYFWTGKGYGINLADDDGFQPTADHSLRAPHNTHIEILARSGVPGLLLWIVLQAAYGLSLLRAAARARARGDTAWVPVLGFIFIYWLAALMNASFDPYLQGPQGGIWFWSMFGVGLAAMRMAEREEAYEGPGEVAAGGPVVERQGPAVEPAPG
ncbi:MAG: O-antigen ligase family protein [Chloroflexota bacterium]